jgi:hypothetical protein
MDQVVDTNAGDTMIHPRDTPHFTEALTDCRYLEVKNVAEIGGALELADQASTE